MTLKLQYLGKSSTGFYSLVAVPAFANTHVGTTHKVAGITMFCYDVTGKIDDTGATVNAVIFFRFTNDADGSSAAEVTIHLHHTVRRIQIQGGTMVNSESRSNIWFLDTREVVD